MPADRRMLFRIGINLGDILIEGDDILGDGVNIAARLEGIAEPGGICISSSAYDQVRGKVAVEFIDLGEQSLKNIALPVRAYAVASNVLGPGEAAGWTPKQISAPRLSIVVLPFANIGGDPEQEYFVDGVTESLTTDLSRISGAFVIARNTAFTFKGKAVDVKKLGRELNVRYVLEGSVQRGGNRLRLNVQLIDVETGNHLWAERFDKPIADLFDMQDEIVSSLANTLDAQLIAAEARRAKRSIHPDAMDLCFQGWELLNKGSSPEHMAQARGFFERALALDPAVSTHWSVPRLLTSQSSQTRSVTTGLQRSRAAETAADQGVVAGTEPCRWLTISWASSTPFYEPCCSWHRRMRAGVSAGPKSGSSRTLPSAWPSTRLVEARKPKPMSARRSASLPAIPTRTCGSVRRLRQVVAGGRCRSCRMVASVRRSQPELSAGAFLSCGCLGVLGELDEARAASAGGPCTSSSFHDQPLSRQRALRPSGVPSRTRAHLMRACAWPGCLRASASPCLDTPHLSAAAAISRAAAGVIPIDLEVAQGKSCGLQARKGDPYSARAIQCD